MQSSFLIDEYLPKEVGCIYFLLSQLKSTQQLPNASRRSGSILGAIGGNMNEWETFEQCKILSKKEAGKI
jgi:hypothetical protein